MNPKINPQQNFMTNHNAQSTNSHIINGLYSGGSGTSAGSLSGQAGGIIAPYTIGTLPPSTYSWPPPTPVVYDIVIRKVENGFILTMEGKEYIITDNSQVLKYLDLCTKKVLEIK